MLCFLFSFYTFNYVKQQCESHIDGINQLSIHTIHVIII